MALRRLAWAGLAVLALAAGLAEARAPRGPADLVRAYPDVVDRIEGGRLYLKNGRWWPISDGRTGKTLQERAARPDIDDIFAEPYPTGPLKRAPTGEPGRVRHEPLFTALYGDCAKLQVKLKRVAWMPRRGGGHVMFAEAHGAAAALERVVADLEKLPPSMTRFLVPVGGTYNCHKIEGRNRRSMHAYAAAIDIAVRHSDYWVWAGGEKAPYRNRIPMEIVAVFEKHGFIWGGKWKHFDTMHFEYRPELLPPTRR